jgi:hypothetical protein
MTFRSIEITVNRFISGSEFQALNKRAKQQIIYKSFGVVPILVCVGSWSGYPYVIVETVNVAVPWSHRQCPVEVILLLCPPRESLCSIA